MGVRFVVRGQQTGVRAVCSGSAADYGWTVKKTDTGNSRTIYRPLSSYGRTEYSPSVWQQLAAVAYGTARQMSAGSRKTETVPDRQRNLPSPRCCQAICQY